MPCPTEGQITRRKVTSSAGVLDLISGSLIVGARYETERSEGAQPMKDVRKAMTETELVEELHRLEKRTKTKPM